MKIKFTNKFLLKREKLLQIIMRASLFLCFTTAFSFAPSKILSQNAKIKIDTDITISVANIFELIQQQADYKFVYSDDLIVSTPKVTLKKGIILAKELLKRVLSPIGCTFEFTDNETVIVKRKNKIVLITEQQKEIKGTVKDKNGEPLPSTNIIEKGTANGVITDFDGKFTLKVTDENAVLVVSYLGYVTQEVAVGQQTVFSITLIEDTSSLGEIVFVGYGSVAKKDLTGAVGSAKVDDISTSATTSIDAALGGRVSGLVAVQTSGQPGAGANIQIRGNASFASAGVLYVVDGVPINGGAGEPGAGNEYGGASRSPLNFINPNDIKSIEILKDASSASIYGARAGAGVVLITTKKGKTGEVKVSFDHSYAFNDLLDFYEVYTERDYMINRNGYERERWMLNNNVGVYGGADPSTLSPFVPIYSDSDISGARTSGSALDEIQRKGYLQQYNVSFSGGDESTKYFVSGNLTDEKGSIINSELKRFIGRINLDQRLNDKFKISINFTTSRISSKNAAIGTGLFENAGVILSAFYHPPPIPLIAEDGSYPLNPEYQNAPNPLSFREITDGTVSKRLLANVHLDYKVIEPLTLRVRYSFDQSNSKRKNYLPRPFLYGLLREGEANILQNETEISLLEYTANYTRFFESGSSLSGVAGYSYQVRNGEGFNTGNEKFLTDSFLFNNLGAGAAEKPSTGSYRFNEVWASSFGRLSFDYLDKYIITGSIRRDGFSRFAKNKKYGLFPSLSVAWKLSSEDFMKNNKLIDFLKVRANYGTTGNSNIGANALSLYATGSNYVFGDTENIGVFLRQLANEDLTWETASEVNIGLDFSILEGKVSGSFDYFNKTISDLLSSRPLPLQSVVGGIAANIGRTQSRGWEFTLSTTNIENDDFSWKTDFNIAHYKDTWKNRDSLVLKSLPKHIKEKDEIRAIYGYVTDGILQAGEEVPEHMDGLRPGMIKLKDLNGFDDEGNLTGVPDGMLSAADQVKLGVNDPGYTFGFSNVFKYKNFDLNIFAYGMLDRVVFNSDKDNAFANPFQFGWNGLIETKNRWSSENQNSNQPSAIPSPYAGRSGNFFRENGAFLRVRNIILGYNIPGNLLNRYKILSSARIYIDIQNPFVITNYSGIDPEVSGFIAYPPQKSLILGVNVNF